MNLFKRSYNLIHTVNTDLGATAYNAIIWPYSTVSKSLEYNIGLDQKLTNTIHHSIQYWIFLEKPLKL